MKTFQTAFPKIRIGVRTGHTEEVLDLVLRREVHIGIGRPVQHPEAVLIPVFEDSLILVVSANHPFARRGKVRLRELAQERLILFDRASSYYELTSSLLRQAGVVPVSVMELDNVEAAKKMVLQGLGVSVLPRMALEADLRSRSLRPVRVSDVPPVRRPIVAIRRHDAGTPVGPVAGFLAVLESVRTGPSGAARTKRNEPKLSAAVAGGRLRGRGPRLGLVAGDEADAQHRSATRAGERRERRLALAERGNELQGVLA